jgi:hypothetical protein
MSLESLELWHYLVLAGVVLFILLIILTVLKKKTPESKHIDVKTIYETLNAGSIEKIDFVRNKINVTVKRPRDISLETLQEVGAIGVNVIGKKLKFYFEDNNEEVYYALLKTMEGTRS